MDSNQDMIEIRALIARQFTSLSWDATTPPDWNGFAADFLPSAPLFPSARPLAPSTVSAFVERIKSVSVTTQTFYEQVLGTTIHVFGHVAVAVVVCEVTENQKDRSQNVEMILLVKDDGAWRIAAQAWDKATLACPIPPSLLANDALGAAKDGPAPGRSRSSGS